MKAVVLVINFEKEDPVQTIFDLTGGIGVDRVIEAVGVDAAVQQRNLTVRGGNCNHRRYIPRLVGMVAAGTVDPTDFITDKEPIPSAIDAYEIFDQREPGWLKVELQPAGA